MVTLSIGHCRTKLLRVAINTCSAWSKPRIAASSAMFSSFTHVALRRSVLEVVWVGDRCLVSSSAKQGHCWSIQNKGFGTTTSLGNVNIRKQTQSSSPKATRSIINIQERGTLSPQMPNKTTDKQNEKSCPRWTIPEATWSVQEMMENHNVARSSAPDSSTSLPPLHILAKRSLIYVDDDMIKEQQIEKDLAHMWNWIQQVRNLTESKGSKNDLDDEGQKESTWATRMANLSDQDIYDVPRGVERGAPVMRSAAQDRDDRPLATMIQESENVWRSFLEPKTKLVGSHKYFVIPTAKTKDS